MSSPSLSPSAKRKAAEISELDESGEPVLSHAEQRRQKKKQKREPADATTPAEPKPTNGKSAERKSDPLPKRQNSVWVGNLAFKTTTVSLKGFFDGVGEITRIHMPMKAANGTGPRENSGYAYVDFASKDAKVVAMTMSEQNLEGRRLLIKDGDDYSTKPPPKPKPEGTSDAAPAGLSKIAQKILDAQKQPPGPTLFFGNLGFQATADSIKELLDAHRKKSAEKKPDEESEEGEKKPAAKDQWIRKVRLGTFEDTGVCKGWAFVDFTNVENATAALVNTRNHTLDGRKLKVEFASPDAVRRGGGPGDRGRPKKEYPKKEYAAKTSEPRQNRAVTRDWALPQESQGEADEETPIQAEETVPERKPKYEGRAARPVRLRPGAALAQAERATSAAIVPSQGKKITF